ncbi:MAG: hypothetical protein ACYTFY_12575 [Planctomycetota bacterium]|jgi:hypothetical protein
MSLKLRAGVAKSDITISSKCSVVSDPLYVKALVLDDGSSRLAILSMDVTAIGGRDVSCRMLDDVGEDFLPDLRTHCEKELGIAGSNILVNASHTHPPGKLLCEDEEQVERAFAAVKRASENMVEVQVGAGKGVEDRITINRTLRMKDGRHWTLRHSNPSPSDEDVAGVGEFDPEIGILRIDKLDGTPLAMLYNFACHPLFGDAKGSVTANYSGYASKVIEDYLGEGAMAIFLQGAAGNIMDISFKDFNQPRQVEPLGTMLGLSALEAYRNIKVADKDLNIITETITVPRRGDIPAMVDLLKREQDELLKSLMGIPLNFRNFLPLYLQYSLNPDYPLADSYKYMQAEKIGSDDIEDIDEINKRNIDKYLQNIKTMEKLARIQDKIATLEKHKSINDNSGEDSIELEIQGIRIGDCVIITSPAEVLVEVGLNIKKASPYEHTFISAYSNGYAHYGCLEEDYLKGGYEVTECFLGAEWQKIFENKAAEIIARL